MSQDCKKLVLHDKHASLGARFAPFAGFEMPMHYTGIKDEHACVREKVGIFDVSHMGAFYLEGADAVRAIDHIVSNDISSLPMGKAAYTVMCVEAGGIVDDLIVYKLADNKVLAIVNASRAAVDFEHMNKHIAGKVKLTNRSDDFVMLAVQGPSAEAVVNPLVVAELKDLVYYGAVETKLVSGVAVTVARTGYTGEDGFEILIPNAQASTFYDQLMEAGRAYGIQPIGLGARDTLRLEAKLPLYGHELSLDINPLEAGLHWVVKLGKEVPFVGQDALVDLKGAGLKRRLRGVIMRERGVLRPDYPLFAGAEQVGVLCSGGPSPTLGYSIGIAYIAIAHADDKDGVEVEIRGKRSPVELTTKPFYKRG